MGYRGRLLFPFVCEIAQLDLAATATDPDFKEPTILSTDDGVGESSRAETLIRVSGSFHTPQTSFSLQQSPTGDMRRVDILIVFHFDELENLGLIEETTGTALIKVGDRLNAIYDETSGALVQKLPNPPGAFVVSASPLFGLGGTRNLLEVRFQSRDQGSTVGG